jgi:hypothetical protein
VNSSQIINANLNVDEIIAFATRAAEHLAGPSGPESARAPQARTAAASARSPEPGRVADIGVAV